MSRTYRRIDGKQWKQSSKKEFHDRPRRRRKMKEYRKGSGLNDWGRWDGRYSQTLGRDRQRVMDEDVVDLEDDDEDQL
jgi:hypothetical protein